jgi:ABC-type lipoprotein release transport system permease subunit
MTAFRLILASLWHHGLANLAVACGVAVGTAVLTGALLVGDSMRGSLRHLTLDRLGAVDEALVVDRFFREQLADEWAAAEQATAVPVILLRGSLEKAESQPPQRANQVDIIGCDERFWQLFPAGPGPLPGRDQVVLNEPAARQLGAAVGDAIMLRLPRPGAVPAESALGQKQKAEIVRSVRLEVSAVLPAEGAGRFALRPAQRPPRNAYVRLSALQEQLGERGKVNAILAVAPLSDGQRPTMLRTVPGPPAKQFVLRAADCGIRVEPSARGYVNITSARMILEPAVEKAILRDLAGETVQPALTYLANTIACGDRQIPYSTITAIDFAATPPLGPMLSTDGKPVPPLGDGQIALNSWAADDLGAKPGDTIRVRYFEPASTHGQVREKTADFRLVAVVRLAGAADDRALTPSVRGITDAPSMKEGWNPPFPFDRRRVRPKDEEYWREHRVVPKAFVSLAEGRRLWASRFGQTTSLRVAPTAGLTAAGIEQKLVLDPAAVGFVFQPVREQGLAASAGTTPFGVLFLAFSSFVVAAAVMLVALLFRLGIERRAAEAGILLALGFRARQVGRLLAAEGLLVALLGSVLGGAAGIAYAALLLAGLRTWWLGAVGTPFLRLYVDPWSLAIGVAGGLAVSMAAIAVSARRLGRLSPRRLLAGETTGQRRTLGSLLSTQYSVLGTRYSVPRLPRWGIDLVLVVLATAPAGVLMAIPLDEDVRAGAFFGAGALALVALLGLAYLHLRWGATGPAVALGRGNLLRMALRSAARNPGRSGLSIALAATACFLIVAVSVFRVDPSQEVPALGSGNGGFALVGQSDQPIYQDFGTSEGRRQLHFPPEDDRLLSDCRIYALRVEPGDDASCLNLYRPRQPRLLGLPRAFLERGGFAWAAAPPGEKNPWLALELPSPPAPLSGAGEGSRKPVTPVVLDQTTADYSLHLSGRGAALTTVDAQGRTLQLEVAGLLQDSIFQGDLLMNEAALLDYDPALAGYRFFLVEAPAEKTAAVGQALERDLGDYGLATETTAERLAGFLAVENTYLSTFQSLGGLGLLLGTIGLAAVALRGVLERRGELALLRAAGFRRAALEGLIVLETLVLLVAGLTIGILAALVAVAPHLAGHGASIPWKSLAALLALVLAVGLLASLAAVRALAREPLLPALRKER